MSRVALITGLTLGAAGIFTYSVNSGPLLAPTLRLGSTIASLTSPHPLTLTFGEAEGTLLFPTTHLKLTDVCGAREVGGEDKKSAASFSIQASTVEISATAFPFLSQSSSPQGINGVGVTDVTGVVELAPDSPPLPLLSLGNFRASGLSLMVKALGHPSPVSVLVTSAQIPQLNIGDVPGSLRNARISGVVDGKGAFEVTTRAPVSGKGALVDVSVSHLPLHRLAPLAPPGNILEFVQAGEADFAVSVLYVDAPPRDNPRGDPVFSHAVLSVKSSISGIAGKIPDSRAALMPPTRKAVMTTALSFLNAKAATASSLALDYSFRVSPDEIERAVARAGGSHRKAFVNLFLTHYSSAIIRRATSGVSSTITSWFG